MTAVQLTCLMLGMISYALVWHFIADFLLQSRDMGTKKSSDIRYLLGHIGIIFSVMLIAFLPILAFKSALIFAGSNAIVHMIIDATIWNGYKFFTARKLRNEAYRATWMNGNLNIPHDVRAAEKLVELKNEFKYYEDKGFYATIGLDQLLHVLTIITIFVCMFLI